MFVHPYAGVLSAFGMGLAEIRTLRERQYEQALSEIAGAEKKLDDMAAEAANEVVGQGVDTKAVRTERRVHLRHRGRAHVREQVAIHELNSVCPRGTHARNADGIERAGGAPNARDCKVQRALSSAVANEGRPLRR